LVQTRRSEVLLGRNRLIGGFALVVILMAAALLMMKPPIAMAGQPTPTATPTPEPESGGDNSESQEPESEESADANTIIDELLAPRPCDMFPQKPVLNETFITGSGWIDCGRTTIYDGTFHVCLMWEGIVLEPTCGSYPMSGKSFEDGYASSGCLAGDWRTHTTLHYLGETYLDLSPTLSVSDCPLPRV
jgi:hypothetical protein